MSDTATLADRLQRLIRVNLDRRAPPRSAEPFPEPDAAEGAHSSSLRSLSNGVSSEGVARGPARPRILIVEADPLHRQILARLLENHGYLVDAAGTAEEAVPAFTRHAYVLVMLDCDSTETRGLEIAAAMRRAENGVERIPIVALTAHSGQEQRQQREAAGIDNYLAKPILHENVESLLLRYAPARSEEPATPVSRYLALDRHRLEELEEAAGDRTDLLSGWLAMFLSNAPELLERMRVAAAENDIAAMSEAAGRLRSRGGQIGALRVQEICGIVAALCGSGSLAGVEALLPELSISLERALQELRTLEGDVRCGRRLAVPDSGRSPRPTNRGSAGGNQVLLVEGDALVARFLSNSLAGAGFAVTHIATGRAALDSLREKEFAIVVLDLDVAEIDGYGVLSEMRTRPEATAPVMIVSARHQEQDILRAFELGADDYITIPFSPLEVAARVRRLVKQGAHVS